MFRSVWASAVAVLLATMGFARTAHAQWAVIDVNAIAQLAQEVHELQQAVQTAQSQLAQAEQQYRSMTGASGMQSLLGGIAQNDLVLHTDEPHPHVHLVVKAVSEQGERLNIRKATLRAWRWEFARHLREQGIAANATERAVRGQSRAHKWDRVYRAAERGASTHMRERTESVAAELLTGGLRVESGKMRLVHTRKAVERSWETVSGILERQGQPELAGHTRRFLQSMTQPQTEREQIAAELLKRFSEKERFRAR